MPPRFDELDFPPGTRLRLREGPAGAQILDRVRRRFVALTPEEWVRQHLVRTLIEHLGYPVGLLALEPTIETAGGTRRPDVVAYRRDRSPAMIAECKAPGVRLSQSVFEQVSRYNVVTLSPVLLVTNGFQHYCWRVDRATGDYRFLETIPSFAEAT